MFVHMCITCTLLGRYVDLSAAFTPLESKLRFSAFTRLWSCYWCRIMHAHCVIYSSSVTVSVCYFDSFSAISIAPYSNFGVAIHSKNQLYKEVKYYEEL